MKRITLLIVTCLLAAGSAFLADRPAAGGGPAITASRDLTDAEVRQTIDSIFRAQVRSRLEWTDSLASVCSNGPLYHLMRARLYRELIPVDDEQKDDIKAAAQPLYDELDKVIAICDERIDAGDPDPDYHLYRGWAHMFNSHVKTYEKAFWSAGREAKKGKDDLEWYLKVRPGDPVASSLMGAFLYFADTLPAAYKFVSKLLFLPSGDRDRGLQMMELARGWNSWMETDNALILYSVYLGFEGRFEEGLDGFHYLQREYPLHVTFVRPDAIMYPLLPMFGSAFGDSLDARLARIEKIPAREQDMATLDMVIFERAYADRIYNPDRAVERFKKYIADAPAHPDWAVGYCAFELGRIYAARGDAKQAREMWDRVLGDARTDYLQDEAKHMLSALEETPGGTGAGPADVPAIYGNDPEARRAVLRELVAVKDPSVADMFYLGEAYLMSGEPGKALDAYTGAINPKAAPWDETFQMIAATRAAEILASRGDYEAAARHYETAGKFWHMEYLYDWVLEARERYFERIKDGEETAVPTLLTRAR